MAEDDLEEKAKNIIDKKEGLTKGPSPLLDSLKRRWYRFKLNPLSLLGLSIAIITIFLAIFGEHVAPHPEHGWYYHNYPARFTEPFETLTYPLGTDDYGRCILSRIILGFRYSVRMAAVVLGLTLPVGVTSGLVAGYHRNTWVDTLIMRFSDVFVAVPPLVLALSITGILEPTAENAMIAVSLGWWPWYARITYNNVSSLVNEEFIKASQIMGANKFHIMFKNLLPNALGPILTKASLDVGLVILIGASLSFVGLGAQAPTPDLGTMVAAGITWFPSRWWPVILPSLAISFIILGFNLLGDGIQEAFEEAH